MLMEPDCVRRFYETVESYPEYDVYHFDIDIINNDNTVQKHCTPYDSEMSSGKFYEDLFNERIDARMPEFIFRTRHFLKSGGFVNFIQAYRSDNATVISCASGTGIRTIAGHDAKVLWRESGINMSSSGALESIASHSDANISFFNWSHRYFGKEYPLSVKVEKRWIVNLLASLYPDYGICELAGRLIKHYRPGNIIYSIVTLLYLVKVLKSK